MHDAIIGLRFFLDREIQLKQQSRKSYKQSNESLMIVSNNTNSGCSSEQGNNPNSNISFLTASPNKQKSAVENDTISTITITTSSCFLSMTSCMRYVISKNLAY